jgi:phosphatidylglycerophosphate synthase
VKKIADVLTFCRMGFGLIVIVLLFCDGPSEMVLKLYIAGLLTDALDGICARRWPYTSTDILRLPWFWWKIRQNPSLFDALTDGVLFYSVLAFTLFRAYWGWIGAVAPFVIFFSLLAVGVLGTWLVQGKMAKLAYRWFFIAELAVTLLALTLAAVPIKYLRPVMLCYLVATIILVVMKLDRLTKI